MQATKKYLDELTYKVIGCAIEVHKQISPGLLESVYEKCFLKELDLQGVKYQKQVWVPLQYKGLELDVELRLDVLVEDLLCVELKAQKDCYPYMMQFYSLTWKCCKNQKAFLINFHCVNIFKNGQKTLVNKLFSELPNE